MKMIQFYVLAVDDSIIQILRSEGLKKILLLPYMVWQRPHWETLGEVSASEL